MRLLRVWIWVLTAVLAIPGAADASRIAETYVDVSFFDNLSHWDERKAHDFLESSGIADAEDFLSSVGQGTSDSVLRIRNSDLSTAPESVQFVAKGLGPDFGGVNDRFGSNANGRVIVEHDLATWVNPPPNTATYDNVVLTVLAHDPDYGSTEFKVGDVEISMVDLAWGPLDLFIPSSLSDAFEELQAELIEADGQLVLRIKTPNSNGTNRTRIIGSRLAASVSSTSPPMPEPSSMALFGLGLIVVGRAVRATTDR